MNKSRAYNAGKQLAEAIKEMVHLMYQNKTAKKFYLGLLENIEDELIRRKIINK